MKGRVVGKNVGLSYGCGYGWPVFEVAKIFWLVDSIESRSMRVLKR